MSQMCSSELKQGEHPVGDAPQAAARPQQRQGPAGEKASRPTPPRKSGSSGRGGVRLAWDRFFRIKMCPWIAEGCCRHGALCNYAHTPEQLRPWLPLYKTKLCDAFKRGECPNEECNFAHGIEELRHTTGYYKTELCQMWLSGSCESGDACRYAHGAEELRPKTQLARKNVAMFLEAQAQVATASKQSAADSGGDTSLSLESSAEQLFRLPALKGPGKHTEAAAPPSLSPAASNEASSSSAATGKAEASRREEAAGFAAAMALTHSNQLMASAPRQGRSETTDQQQQLQQRDYAGASEGDCCCATQQKQGPAAAKKPGSDLPLGSSASCRRRAVGARRPPKQQPHYDSKQQQQQQQQQQQTAPQQQQGKPQERQPREASKVCSSPFETCQLPERCSEGPTQCLPRATEGQPAANVNSGEDCFSTIDGDSRAKTPQCLAPDWRAGNKPNPLSEEAPPAVEGPQWVSRPPLQHVPKCASPSITRSYPQCSICPPTVLCQGPHFAPTLPCPTLPCFAASCGDPGRSLLQHTPQGSSNPPPTPPVPKDLRPSAFGQPHPDADCLQQQQGQLAFHQLPPAYDAPASAVYMHPLSGSVALASPASVGWGSLLVTPPMCLLSGACEIPQQGDGAARAPHRQENNASPPVHKEGAERIFRWMQQVTLSDLQRACCVDRYED